MSSEHPDEVCRLVRELARRADRNEATVGLALVGSWARGAATPQSDVDLVVLGDVPALIKEQPWADVTASAELIRVQTFGVVEERRFRFPSGLVLEIGIAPCAWASTNPLDSGTRLVVTQGIQILYDRGGLLKGLVDTVLQT